ncbi:hypothetical protein MSAN_00501800 [Mycena sanguinolenta]|uniref:Uncharacterized protein n=1 Tax=Mycena sanguinolenta TaxID=230812 RepID=A0A8H6Z5I1_9AGAR|nr:hypothetical protein MSAN_00501800 [Mycena sanguinolenta]
MRYLSVSLRPDWAAGTMGAHQAIPWVGHPVLPFILVVIQRLGFTNAAPQATWRAEDIDGRKIGGLPQYRNAFTFAFRERLYWHAACWLRARALPFARTLVLCTDREPLASLSAALECRRLAHGRIQFSFAFSLAGATYVMYAQFASSCCESYLDQFDLD